MNEAPPVMDSPPPPPLPNFKDRRTGLLIFGIIEIFLGVICLLLTGLMLVGLLMLPQQAGNSMNLHTLAPALATYLAMAVIFVWLGIGSMQCRRWARALMLILGWWWLLIGTVTVPLMVVVLPKTLKTAAQQGQNLPPGVMTVVIIVQILFMTVLLIVLPAVFVFFYRSPHVKATCEARHPVPGWTDACPLPLLGVALFLWLGAAFLLLFPVAYRGVMPFFGILLEGWSGTFLALGLAALWFWLGRTWYRVQPIGWCILLTVLILLSVSSFLTFQRVDLMEMYQKMGYQQEQIDMIRRQGVLTNQLMAWSSVLWLVPMFGYLIWVKRFFKTPR